MKKLKSMTDEARVKALAKVAEELQEVCEFKPPIKTKGKSEAQLTKLIKEGAGQLVPEDDELTKATEAHLTELGFLGDTKEVPEAEVPTVAEVVKDADNIKALREIVENFDEFKKLRKKLSEFRNQKVLRKAMLELISDDEEEQEEEKPKTKKELRAEARAKKKAEAKAKAEEEEEEEEEKPKTKKQLRAEARAKKKAEAEAEEADEKPKKKASKKGKGKSDKAPSNKAIVYDAWEGKKGEKDTKKLAKLVKGAVKETTIRSWVNNWGRGKKIPAGR